MQTLTVILPVLLIQSMQTLDVTELNDFPGIYFNFLGNAEIFQSHWTLAIHYNLENYFYEYDTLSYCTNEIQKLCTKLEQIHANAGDCQIMYKQLKLQLKEIQNTQEILLHAPHRSRRSLMDGGGAVLNYLIGTLDQNYAKNNDDNLAQLKNRQNFQSELLKNHTSILDNTVDLIQKDRNAIDEQVHMFNKHLQQIDFDIDSNELKADLTQHLAFVSTYTTLIFSRFRDTQISITNLLANTQNYASSVQSLMPTTMSEQIQFMEENLPPNVHLPKVNNKLDVNLIYKTSDIQSTLIAKQILCEFQIPLLMNIDFQLFQALSIPTKGLEGYTYVKPEQENMLVSYDRNHITYLTPEELSHCHSLPDAKFICKDSNPIFNPTTTRFDCERKLLNHVSYMPETCKIKKTIPGQYWIQLSPNKYLFVLDKPQTVELICSRNISYSKLKNTGIVKIPPKCQIRTDEITLNAETTYINIKEESFVPSINISQVKLENTSQSIPFILKIGRNNQLEDINNQLSIIKKSQEQEPAVLLHFKQNNHYYLFALMLALMTILVIIRRFNLIKILRNKCSKTDIENPYTVMQEFANPQSSTNNPVEITNITPITETSPKPIVPQRNLQ